MRLMTHPTFGDLVDGRDHFGTIVEQITPVHTWKCEELFFVPFGDES
jgi:hypothetical protein